MARVALIGENSVYFIEKLLKIWNNGDCAVLIDWRVPPKTAVEMMKESGVVECWIEQRMLVDYLECETSGIKVKSYCSSNVTENVPRRIHNMFKNNYSDSEAVIIFSSGTTGKSKGIILSHYAINKNADAIIDYISPVTHDSLYIIKSLSHSSTLTGELLMALKANIRILVSPTVVPPRYILNNIVKYGISIICVNPLLLKLYANEYNRHKYDIKTLKAIYVSGSILDNDTYEYSKRTFRNISIYNVYGLSEAGPRVTAQRKECCSGNSVGKPILNVEIKILSNDGIILKKGERGIVHVHTPCIYSGYIKGTSKHESLYNGWLNTGDIGYVDDNDELHIVNRIDDVIIINSHKVYPSDIEQLLKSVFSFEECKLFKIGKGVSSYIGCLYTGVEYNEIDIFRKLKKHLPLYEVPKKFIHVQNIPCNNNGKISTKDALKCFEDRV